MKNQLTHKMIKTLGRAWLPFARPLVNSEGEQVFVTRTKTVTASTEPESFPAYEAGVEYGFVLGDDVVQGEISTIIDSPSLLNTVFKASQDVLADLFKDIPLTGVGKTTVQTTADGGRKVTTTVPVTPPPAETAPPAEAARRTRGPAKPKPEPEAPPAESSPEPDPAGDENSEPVAPSGRTLEELSAVVCCYGKQGGQMRDKTLGQLGANQIEWLAHSDEFSKYLDRPGHADLRTAAQEFQGLKKLVG
jgi:hypothetical protein